MGSDSMKQMAVYKDLKPIYLAIQEITKIHRNNQGLLDTLYKEGNAATKERIDDEFAEDNLENELEELWHHVIDYESTLEERYNRWKYYDLKEYTAKDLFDEVDDTIFEVDFIEF